MLPFFLNLFLIAWEAVCCRLLMGTFSENRKYKYRAVPAAVFWGMTAFAYGAAVVFNNDLLLKNIAVILLLTTGMYFLYHAKLSKIFALAVLYQGINIASDCAVMLLLGQVASIILGGETDAVPMTYGSAIISKIVLLFIILLVKYRMGKDKEDMLTSTEWLELLVIPVVTILSIVVIVLKFGITKQIIQDGALVCIVSGMALMNVMVFVLVESIFKRERAIRENQVLAEKARRETEMYYCISENLDRQRRFTHEFKNHLSCICELAEKGEYGGLEAYVGKLNGELLRNADMVDTNNVIVNAIINTKYREAMKKGIVFVLKVNDLSALTISDMDIVTILTNLLDNAMEACRKCREKIVRLKFVIEDGQTVISVKNSMEKKPVLDGETFLTSKTLMAEETQNGVRHGIGIKNVCNVLEKYHAKYLIDYDEKEFVFSIVI